MSDYRGQTTLVERHANKSRHHVLSRWIRLEVNESGVNTNLSPFTHQPLTFHSPTSHPSLTQPLTLHSPIPYIDLKCSFSSTSSSGNQPTTTVVSSSSNNALIGTASSFNSVLTTTTASSSNKPKTPIKTPPKTPAKPTTSKTPTKASKSKTTPESAGNLLPRYNPDIDADTEENIDVLQPKTITTRKSGASRGDVEETTTTSPSGSIDDENGAPARNNTEVTPRRPTIGIHIPQKPSTPEKQPLKNMASLNLQDGPREGRQEHPDYPDVPKEVPVDEDGVPTAYYSKVNGKVQIWGAKK